MPRRALNETEMAHVAGVFRGAIKAGKVAITRGHIASVFSATTLGNTIHLQRRHFHGDTLDLTHVGEVTLTHELGHVWQYQNHGWGYVARSLFAQLKAWLTTGSRAAAYDWPAAAKADRAWEDWNPEEQAECIACYGRAWQRKQTGKSAVDDDEMLSRTAKYMDKVWPPQNVR